MFFLKDDRCCCVLFTIGYDPTTKFFVFSKSFFHSIYKSILLSCDFNKKVRITRIQVSIQGLTIGFKLFENFNQK